MQKKQNQLIFHFDLLGKTTRQYRKNYNINGKTV